MKSLSSRLTRVHGCGRMVNLTIVSSESMMSGRHAVSLNATDAFASEITPSSCATDLTMYSEKTTFLSENLSSRHMFSSLLARWFKLFNQLCGLRAVVTRAIFRPRHLRPIRRDFDFGADLYLEIS